uniref:Secreted protein n=1 Tax=Arundo donax TaxID=35708 RepID=A0A0A9FTL4_ARUDO
MSPPLAWAFLVIHASKCGALSLPYAPRCCTRLHQAAWSEDVKRRRDLHHHHCCPVSGCAQGMNRGDYRRSR